MFTNTHFSKSLFFEMLWTITIALFFGLSHNRSPVLGFTLDGQYLRNGHVRRPLLVSSILAPLLFTYKGVLLHKSWFYGFPYILGYKPISRISRPFKNFPKGGFLQKLAYKPTPKIPRCVVCANNKRVSICNALCLIRRDYVAFYLRYS